MYLPLYSSILKKETLVEAWSKPDLSSSCSPQTSKPTVAPDQLSWTTPSTVSILLGGWGNLTSQALPVLWSRRQMAGT